MKYALALIVLVVLIFGGYLLYSYQKMPQSNQPIGDQMMQKDQPAGTPIEQSEMMEDQMSTNSADQMNPSMTKGEYVEYSRSALDNAASGKRVLFFYASWCPTCRPADADFKANQSQIPDGVTLIRVNYNDPQTDADEKALAQKYAVTYQHTFVQINPQGKQISKWNGGKLAELISNLQ